MTDIYALGSFQLDVINELLFRINASFEITAPGRPTNARSKATARRPSATRSVPREAAWPGQIVEESNLTVQIAALRRALGSEPGGERWNRDHSPPRLPVRRSGPYDSAGWRRRGVAAGRCRPGPHTGAA